MYYNLKALKDNCSVNEFVDFNKHYTEVVNQIGLDTLKTFMPCSLDILKKQYEAGNIHFNSTGDNQPYSLRKWDLKAQYLPVKNASLSQRVCILKQAARMLCEEV
jgi:hypothetical protein